MASERLARVPRSPRTRLLGIALGLTAVILAALILPPWLSAAIPYREVRRASRMLLLAAQPAYGATLALLVTGLGVLGRTVVRARSQGESRPWAARWLLLCVSGVLAIVTAEVAAAGWRAWAHRHPAIPAFPTRFDDQ